MRLVPPVSASSGQLEFYWVDPQGVVRNLNKWDSPNRFVSLGSVGLGGITTEIADSKLPKAAGTFIHQLNINAREINLPITIHEESIGDLILAVEDVAGWFDTGDENRKTPGYLRIVWPNGTVRQLLCYVTDGLEGDTNEGGVIWNTYTVGLYAPDPFPTAQSNTTVEKTLTEALLFGIINDGKKEAYPIWTFTGPFTSILLTNNTNSETLNASVDLDIAVGETLVIDTRPSESRPGLQVYDNTGANRITTLTPTSKFWHLTPGLNSISINFGGSDLDDTTVTLDYLPRSRTMFR